MIEEKTMYDQYGNNVTCALVGFIKGFIFAVSVLITIKGVLR